MNPGPHTWGHLSAVLIQFFTVPPAKFSCAQKIHPKCIARVQNLTKSIS